MSNLLSERREQDTACIGVYTVDTEFTFTFMHLADAFIQSDLHCIQVTVSTFFFIRSCFPWESNP